jgi:hypothetical protein
VEENGQKASIAKWPIGFRAHAAAHGWSEDGAYQVVLGSSRCAVNQAQDFMHARLAQFFLLSPLSRRLKYKMRLRRLAV